MKKKILSLCMAIVLLFAMLPPIALTAGATGVVQSGTCGDNLTWVLDDSGTLIISGSGPMEYYYYYDYVPWHSKSATITSVFIENGVTTIGEYAFFDCASLTSVTIPDSVTAIGEYAFYDCASLTSVTIPDSVTAIGRDAFGGCASLTSVTIPDSVTTIGFEAFYGCASLSSVTIPDSVTTIGDEPFASCDCLTEIRVDENNLNYSSDDWGVLFDKEKAHLIQAPGAMTGSYSIPDSVTTICDGAFNHCDSLRSVTIPDSVTTIGEYAFYACDSLTSVTIPDSVTTIDNNVFWKCGSLTSVTIPDSVTTIGYSAFDDCNSLISVTIPDSVTTIGHHAFAGCASLTSVVIPDSVTTIDSPAFARCDRLAEVTFLGDAPTIGEACFYGVAAIAYYPDENATWTADVMQDYGGELTWVAIDVPNPDGFWLNKDGWTFANAAQSFAEEPVGHAGDYYIPRERYDALYGKAYVDAHDDLFTTEWGGNCAGMSATAILFFLDKLDWESIDAAYTEDFANPNDFYRTVNLDQKSQSYYPAIGNDTELTRLIEAYQLYINAINRSRLVKNLENTYFAAEPEIGTLQGVTAENKPIVTTNYTYRHIPASEGGTYIASMLTEFQKAYDENKPLLIALHGDDFGHGVVARTDLKPEDTGDGWWRVYVYDPNKPYMNESVTSTVSGVEVDPKYKYGSNTLIDNGGDIYLELNPTLNQWRYCTSVNSNNADSYIGSTESGNLLWNGVYAKNENNEQYHILRPDFFYTIDLTSFTMEDYANPHFDSTSSWIPENELAVAVDDNTNCSIYGSTGELVAIVEDGDAFVLSAEGGFSSYIGQSEDGGSLGGTLYLPNDVYTVYYTSGSVRFQGNNNVLSFSCDGAAELTVDITLNSLQILAQEDGIVAAKCANVASADECSYVDTEGTLIAGETFTIAYSDENKVEASTNSKDGEFQLYERDANQEEAIATKVIKSSSLWWLWIVGGVAVAGVVLIMLLKKKKPNA